MEFEAFPKIARWYRNVIVSEKIDGSNGAVYIEKFPDGVAPEIPDSTMVHLPARAGEENGWYFVIKAASRSRFVTPKADNFGFARWVFDNAGLLFTLGPGVHSGEWWGRGIQRGYGKEDRTFSLFNTGRWRDPNAPDGGLLLDEAKEIPAVPGLSVVPVLYCGPLRPENGNDPIEGALRRLQYSGSLAQPGYKPPEGIVVWHEAGRFLAKATLDGDGHKGT